MPLKVEVHAYEKWLTLDWQRRHLDPLIISPPDFHQDTDAHIFYEWAILDDALYRRAPVEKRFGLLLESSLNREVPARSISHIDQYRTVFTHDPFLLACHPKYQFNPHGMSWVYQDGDLLEAPPKSRLISIITSNLFQLPGHKLRLSIARRLSEDGHPVHIFGRGIPWGPCIQDRREGLAPYFFNIAIENCQQDNYFTEKLIDCFVTRTVPLYWGCPNISDFFNPAGMITFNSEGEFWMRFGEILADARNIYEQSLPAMEENLKIAAEKYNVKQAWGSLAERIVQSIQSGYQPQPSCLQKRIALCCAQKSFLYQDHGFKRAGLSFVPDRWRSFLANSE